jgi:hypothetical protein
MSTSGKVSSAVSGNTWYFDSACRNHMSPDSQLFSSVIPTTHAPLIQTANGSYISANHTGSVSTLHCLSLTHILFPTSLLISSLLVNYVNLVMTCGLVLLVVVCKILRRIKFLGQAVEWDGCSSSLHSTFLPP